MFAVVHALAAIGLLSACADAGPEGLLGSRSDALAANALEPSAPVGVGARGTFHVGGDGSAAYDIPLWVPPGRAGVQPDLRLSYNSRGGEGALGLGWTASGRSVVSRCMSTPSTDGHAQAVDFTRNDHLCLDGRRLVHVGGSPHGDDGAIYRPRRDGYERVTLHRPLEDSDSWFEVEHPDGSTTEYGHGSGTALRGARYSTDSGGAWTVIEESTMYWMRSSHRDAHGNSMEFEYTSLKPTLDDGRESYELLLSEIRYTDHPLYGNGQRYVRYHYEAAAPVARTSYLGGLALSMTRQLTRISTHAPASDGSGEEAQIEYRFTHSSANPTSTSLLTELTVCDQNGTCLPPTRFEYPGDGDSRVWLSERSAGSTPPGWHTYSNGLGSLIPWRPREAMVLADVDGDARDDLVYLKEAHVPVGGHFLQYEFAVRMGGTYDFGPEQWAGLTPNVSGTVLSPELGGGVYTLPMSPFDIDNDGRTDIFDYRSATGDRSTPGYLHQWEWDPDAGTFTALSTNLFGCTRSDNLLSPRVVLADPSGSGRPSLITGCDPASGMAGTVDWLMRSQGADHGDLNPVETLVADAVLNSTGSEIVIDTDSDARTELLFADGTSAEIDPATGVPETNSHDYDLASQYVLYLDVNGDQLRDLVDMDARTVRYNTGRGHTDPADLLVGIPPAFPDLEDSSSIFRVLDMNSDGREDVAWIMHSGAGQATLAVLLNRGDGLVYDSSRDISAHVGEQQLPGGVTRSYIAVVEAGDPNGDGRTDLVYADEDDIHVLSDSGPIPYLLTAVTLPAGGKNVSVLEVEYAGLSAAGRVDRVWHPASSYYEPVPNAADGSSGCSAPATCVYRGPAVVVHHSELAANYTDAATSLEEALARRYFDYSYEGGTTYPTAGGGLAFRGIRRTEWRLQPVPALLAVRVDTEVVLSEYDTESFGPDGAPLNLNIPTAVHTHVPTTTKGYHLAHREDHTVKVHSVSGFSSSIYFTQVTNRLSRDYELTTAPAGGRIPDIAPATHTVNRKMKHDDHGVVRLWATSVDDGAGATEVVIAVPAHDVAENIYGIYSHVEKTSTNHGDSAVSRMVFDYEPGTFALTDIDIEQNGEHRSLVRELDAAGLVDRMEDIARAPDPADDDIRVTTVSYDTDEHMFAGSVERKTNGLSLVTSFVRHRGTGLLQHTELPDGSSTTTTYDALGRVVGRGASTGASVDFTFHGGTGGTSQYLIHADGADGSWAAVDVDLLGREVSRQWNEGGSLWERATEYGIRGESLSEEYPHLAGTSAPTVQYEYDAAYRLTTVTNPNGSIYSSFDYPDIDTTVHSDALGNTVTRRYDANGQLERVTEAAGDTVYRYGAFGRPLDIDPPGPNKHVWTYQPDGSLDWISDNSGEVAVDLDARAEAILERHPSSSTTLHRDALGRLTERVDYEGSWTRTYDSCGAGSLGHLCQTTSSDLTREEFDYFDTGPNRGLLRSYTIVPEGDASAETTLTYDYHLGRLSSLSVQPASGGGANVTLNYLYASSGELDRIDRVTASGTEELWSGVAHPLSDYSSELLDSHESVSNSVDLLTRQVSYAGVDAHYDNAWNVTDATGNASFSSMGYDAMNRVSTDTAYNAAGDLLEHAHTTGVGFDSLGQIDSFQGEDVAVDDRGRVRAVDYQQRDYSYTDFDLLRSIESHSNASDRVEFAYTGQYERAAWSEGANRRHYYASDVYERHVEGAFVTDVIRVQAPHRQAMMLVSNNGGPYEAFLTYQNHVGSTDRIVRSDDGKTMDAPVFGVFGTARFAGGNWSRTGEIGDYARYAGHEMDAWPSVSASMGGHTTAPLVNMRGREYDPELGRFLTPDPMVGFTGDGAQAWHPYIYANNSPATFTDPTGFFPLVDRGTGPGSGELEGALWAAGNPTVGLGVEYGAGSFLDNIGVEQVRAFFDGTVRGFVPFMGLLPRPRMSPTTDRYWRVGEVVGSVVGLYVDAMAISGGITAAGEGGVLTLAGTPVAPVTAGGSLAPGAALGAAGLGMVVAGVAAGAGHVANISTALSDSPGGSVNHMSNSGGGGGSGRGGTASSRGRPEWTSHGGKHVARRSTPWNRVVESTRRGPAKYRHGTNIEAVERQVWAEGREVTNGRSWRVMEFDRVVGASEGRVSRWVRVEESAGTIHGHPISLREFRRLTR